MKNIKTKENIRKEVHTLDKQHNLSHFIKKQNIKTKQQEKREQESKDTKDPNKQAVDQVVAKEKRTAIESFYKTKATMKTTYRKHRNTVKQKKGITSEGTVSNENKLKIKVKELHKESKGIKTTNTLKPVLFHDPDPAIYQKRGRLPGIHKHKQKILDTNKTVDSIKAESKNLGKGITKAFKGIKHAVSNVNALLGLGGSLILLVVITLFLGIFSAL